jgi:hypothetical protein
MCSSPGWGKSMYGNICRILEMLPNYNSNGRSMHFIVKCSLLITDREASVENGWTYWSKYRYTVYPYKKMRANDNLPSLTWRWTGSQAGRRRSCHPWAHRPPLPASAFFQRSLPEKNLHSCLILIYFTIFLQRPGTFFNHDLRLLRDPYLLYFYILFS